MRVAIAQINVTIGAFAAITEKMIAALKEARAAGAELVVFSELTTSGYAPRDLLHRKGFVEGNLKVLEEVAAYTDDALGALIGFVEPNPGQGKPFYNAAALCHGGKVQAIMRKSLLPTYDVFDEDRYFEEATSVAPLPFKGVKLGVTICEDLWNDAELVRKRLYHRDPIDELVEQGAQLLINLSASPFDLGKARVRRDLVRHKAAKHGRYFVYVNQVGGHDELIFDGHSMICDPAGETVLRARDFAEDLLVYDVPDAQLRGAPAAAGIPGTLREVRGTRAGLAHAALVLGLRDYVVKCGFSRVIVALSGGVDSALVTCLAVEALGAENVRTVAMPTRYSSEHSLTDAAALAANLGVQHEVVPIDDLFAAYLSTLSGAFEGRAADVTEENIQSRIRGSVVMALSNKLGHLVLSTGNKSEVAMGYATLYGDMCGALAVIADVPKTLVYDVCRFINRAAPIIPQRILTKAPSAELRPDQKDSDSLPPYDVLDRIIEAYVEEEKGVDEIVALGLPRELVADVVHKIDLSEYKRWQAAPGLRITPKAFGIGRRWPIAASYRTL